MPFGAHQHLYLLLVHKHQISLTDENMPQCKHGIHIDESDKQNTGDHGDEVPRFTGGQQESGGFMAIACSVSRCHLIVSNEKNHAGAVSIHFALKPSDERAI